MQWLSVEKCAAVAVKGCEVTSAAEELRGEICRRVTSGTSVCACVCLCVEVMKRYRQRGRGA